MQIISIIDKENNEWFFDKERIEWRDNLKTKTHSDISSYIINNKIVVTSFMKIKYRCEICGVEMISLFHNFKKRKSGECISCIRKRTVSHTHKQRNEKQRKEINKRISKGTKETMSLFSEEKKKIMQENKVAAINWEERNKKWNKTMSSKSKEEKDEMYRKVSKTLNNKTLKEKKEIRVKVKKSWLEKYGVEHISQNEDILKKQMKNRKDSFTLKTYNSKFGPIGYQTKPELSFIKYCESNNIVVKNGPIIDYSLNESNMVYKVDFETENYLIEIKSNHIWYDEDLKSGKIKAKNKAANNFAAKNNKKFLFLLDVKDYSKYL